MNYNVVLLVDSSMIGGIETHLVELSKLLSRNHIECSILFYKHHCNQGFYDMLDKENISYDFLQGNINSLLKKLSSFNNQTVIHTHGYKAGILGRIACKVTNKRCISTFHAGEAGTGKVKLYNKLDRWLCALSTNFAVSNKIKDTLRNAHLMENFISLQHTKYIPPNNLNKPMRIGFVGRLSFEKGPDIFFQLAKNMQQNKGVEFHVFGQGPLQSDIPVLNNLLYHGLTDRGAIWEKIDALLICSREEGLPMTLLEAMSQRKFIISSSVGAIPSIIEDSKTGFLMPEGDANDCQKRIEQLLLLPNVQKLKMLDNAYNMLDERFSGKKQFLLLQQAYTGQDVTEFLPNF
ncbi:glycosyltransferase [Pseudoalteromonas aliena]|uniref:Glycosyltransferase subfamily 4-like N-terminal domain-containing protein n=1 Tax=Pseudoalteromonas aliena SW19 TaxID=1314866 RepID=A0ABR9DX85_9GAMM|nr:glycosyltransferase [Pseudoalteromonas aliena]MBE0358887.1 hypothetical protein [Pseudoalteromonas aliena SW19]